MKILVWTFAASVFSMNKRWVLVGVLLAVATGPIKVSGQGRRICPRLERPWNGRNVGPCQRFLGSECTVECRQPYVLVGSRVRVCQSDGTWSGQPTSCELEPCVNCGGSCPGLNQPNNAVMSGQCNPGVQGSACSFRCLENTVLEGPSSIVCLSNGQWSGNTPRCRATNSAICSQFLNIPNGSGTCSLQNGITVCRVTCNAGYTLIGQSTVTCSGTGELNDVLPSCQRITESGTCQTLTPPSGGRLVGSCTSASVGDTCQLVCISGFRPSDTRILRCQANGQWSNSLPRCIGTQCPSIFISQGGSTSGTCNPGVIGQSCTVSCQPGYVLTGTATVTCLENGAWSGGTPTCTRRSCPPLQTPAGGTTSGSCNPGVVGQRCNFMCNFGYRLVGESSVLCGNNGRWSANTPTCVSASCQPLRPPTNGQSYGQCNPGTVGQSCSFTCNSGFQLVGDQRVTCNSDGSWSGTTPSCVGASCQPLRPPTNGQSYGQCNPGTVGQSCSFTCNSGFQLVGDQRVTCNSDGSWSGTTPSCVGNSCPALAAPFNGGLSGSCSRASIGETCTFYCQSGYTLNGQSTLFCGSGGTWSSNPPTCTRQSERECPALNEPPNAEFIECDNRIGGRCVVACQRGYLRSGSRVRTCLAGGTWSGFAPTCVRQGVYGYRVVPLWSLLFG